jgi:threonylcarbamoyladenosine tRNA methylthiotransferase CDKAL1
VIGPTEARMVRRCRALGERLPRLIVTGCLVPLRADLLPRPSRGELTLVPIRRQPRIPALLDGGERPGAPDRPPADAPAPPTATAEVVIAQGCTSYCTYCYSRLARGPLDSVPADAIVRRVSEARDRGAVEVRLASLDTSCWGMDGDRGDRLPELLRAVASIPGRFVVRVGMMSPQRLAPIAEAFCDALAHPRFFRFVHLPVQSGADRVLEAMRRGYDRATFVGLVERARRGLPDLVLSTDVIVGFPGETDSDFERTTSLLEEVEPELVNVTRCSPRPHTPAAARPAVPPGVAKRRSRRLAELRMRPARRRLERWVGVGAEGVVVERGRGDTSLVRLANYLPVVLPGRSPLGATGRLRVDGARSTYLEGRLR